MEFARDPRMHIAYQNMRPRVVLTADDPITGNEERHAAWGWKYERRIGRVVRMQYVPNAIQVALWFIPITMIGGGWKLARLWVGIPFGAGNVLVAAAMQGVTSDTPKNILKYSQMEIEIKSGEVRAVEVEFKQPYFHHPMMEFAAVGVARIGTAHIDNCLAPLWVYAVELIGEK